MFDRITRRGPRAWIELFEKGAVRSDWALANQRINQASLRAAADDFSTRSQSAGVNLDAFLRHGADRSTTGFDHWLAVLVGSQETHVRGMIRGLGSWIGERLIEELAGEWVVMEEDLCASRVGFSDIFLEVAPFSLASALVRTIHTAGETLRSQLGAIREKHVGMARVRAESNLSFSARHYVRLHTMPLVQWMALDPHVPG